MIRRAVSTKDRNSAKAAARKTVAFRILEVGEIGKVLHMEHDDKRNAVEHNWNQIIHVNSTLPKESDWFSLRV